MISCEDSDLCERLRVAGFNIFQAHAVRAVHSAGDKSLRVFFRKHTWRSMGMFKRIGKPVLVTLAHLFLCTVAIANLAVGPASLFARMACFALLVNIAPAMTILYRAWQTKSALYAPVRSMLLYHVYFLARFYAMWKLLLSSRASLEERNAMSVRLHG